MPRIRHAVLGLLLVITAQIAHGEPRDDFSRLDQDVRALKQDVLELNRDLRILEEELLFPANTRLAVFLSADVGELFRLDSVQVRLNDQVVANYLYTPEEVDALNRGGVQRLYLGNVRNGEHELTAFFVGYGPHGREYRRATSVNLEKTSEPAYIELRIQDSQRTHQPEFLVEHWESERR
ncbi:AraC family transcriptional regulator [Alkalilimnicola ehrlichii]|uniref:AraC family transcriptional regulator n=1 Tax=Alkalilimnicola ehrlichii TaxID=351052 RepID=A0A3E0X0S6_9GAMM|nr:AraC family transcriptional regulator [Alkalilimnicola ehrlichii]RFA30928.1 AraC family transcriptional regulator [Alkalilimnicola ehrlichii]RFA38878.1 AraC family transcriptional regulator [Alkalilimnicola ehrlichii]